MFPHVFYSNALGMKLCRINTREFTMGSSAKEAGRNKDEQQHAVNLTKPFSIGVHEVTVGQFAAFVKETGYLTTAEKTGEGAALQGPDGKWKKDPSITWKNPGFAQTADHPVVCLTWHDARAFCTWLSKKENKRYALPTEAQWEFCCRAGGRGKFSFGNDDNLLSQYAWYSKNADQRTHPVGTRKPNGWGLFDMHGNVAEWCSDWYDPDYLKGPGDNPVGPPTGTKHVTRGGGWSSSPTSCRSAVRFSREPTFSDSTRGFRVVVLPDELVTNSIGMKLKLIGTGKFTMGSPPNEAGRGNDEVQHEVAVTRPFYLGVHHVTVGQFKAFVQDAGFQTAAEKGGGANRMFPDNIFKRDPATNWRNPGFPQTDEHPVVCVNSNDAMAFCKWLSKKEGRHYSLPTEAQWEFCCRAGSRTRFHFGDDERKLGEYAWTIGNSARRTHPVGKKKPNAWGLFDMIGNANQRTADWYAADYGKTSPRDDPPGPVEGRTIVVRGGGWATPVTASRSAWRYGGYGRGGRSTHTGFRVVLAW